MVGRRNQSGACSLAEYLRLQDAFEPEDRDTLAELLSLQRIETPPRNEPEARQWMDRQPGEGELGVRIVPSDSSLPDASDYPAKIPLFNFIQHRASQEKKRPATAKAAPRNTPQSPPGQYVRQRIPSIRLQPWENLWPFIKRELNRRDEHGSLDVPRLIDDICAVRPLNALPLSRRQSWPQELIVLVDYSAHLTPVYEDFLDIIQRLRGWFGDRVVLWLLEDAEQTRFEEWRGGKRQRHDALPAMSEHAAVLVLSDLGMLHPHRWARYNWREWGRLFHARRCQPLALVPTHPGDWEEATTRHFRCASLDYSRHSQCEPAAPARRNAEAELDDLLTLLAPMARITPALLRQARIEHPAGLSISAELAFWSDPRWGAVQGFREWRDGDMQREYLERLERDPHLRRLAEKLIQKHEKSLPLRLQIQQRQILLLPLGPEQGDYLRHLHAIMQELEPLERRFLDNWMALLEDRKGEAAWLEELEPLYRQYYEQLSPDQQRDKAPPPQDEAEPWWLALRESAMGLSLDPAPQAAQPALVSSARDRREIAVIEATGSAIVRGYEGSKRTLKQVLHPAGSFSLFGNLTRLTIDTGGKVEDFEWITRPPWATGIGRDRYGLFVEVGVKGVPFVMRWIPPGEFLMGSPPDEPERDDNEGPQHWVRFEQGFWLAETACTQALWQAVMGENPSEFKGEENPVENISWNDAKWFIEKINGLHPGLELRLPSEAEWEYACRAGMTTPFWFGSELTTEKANYDGNYPYANGPKGEYRKKTVPARHFQPNPWGLYQMHGNVWEWCEDTWHDSYEGAPEDGQPWLTGGEQGWAVLRGGAWFSDGGFLRSAYRSGALRGDAGIFVNSGFRLARGPELKPAQPGGAGAASGQPERGTSEADPKPRRRR